jgi:lipopolysaccharide export system permease protein
MNLMHRYMLRQLLVAATVATAVLVLAILLTQSMRLIQVIVEGQVGAGLFVRLVVLSMPEFLIAVLPVGAVAAVLFVYNRLLSDGEILVMRGAGIGPWRLALPGLAVAFGVTLVSYAMTLYFWPVANREFRDLRAIAESDYSTALLQTGAFNAIGDDVTVFIRGRDAEGALRGILLHDTRDRERSVTMIAESGAVQDTPTGPRVVMLDGMRQEFERPTGRMQTLQFEQYSVDLEVVGPDLARSYRAPAERFLGDLLYPDPTKDRDVQNYKRLVTEGHMRLTVPLLPLTFGIVALGVLLRGDFNRRGLGHRILAAIAVIVAVQAAALGLSGAARDDLALIPLMYALPAAAMAGGLAAILLPARLRPRTIAPPEPAAA